MLQLFFEGTIIGISVAAPLGPVGIICINRTLTGGFLNGFVSGLGAATADLLYGILVVLGISGLTTFLLEIQVPIRITGILFIVFLGVRNIINLWPKKDTTVKNTVGITSYTTTFFITLTNPLTIVFFIGIMAGAGLVKESMNYFPALALVAGIFAGSLLWWICLAGATNILRARIREKSVVLINRMSGVVLILFAVYLFIKFMYSV